MKNLILLFFLIAFSPMATADDWILSTGSNEADFFIQKGSLQITKNQAGLDIAVVTAKVIQKQDLKISLEKWYVKVSDCIAHQGKLVTLHLDGTYNFENDFIFGAGSIASSNAEIICAAFTEAVKQVRGKSL